MFMTMECKYHAPCGLCTYYNKQCDEICNQKPKRGLRASMNPIDDACDHAEIFEKEVRECNLTDSRPVRETYCKKCGVFLHRTY